MIFSLNDEEQKKIISLFAQHERNLDYLLYLQSIIWQKPYQTNNSETLDDPYKKRDFLFDCLEKDYPYPNDYVKKNIKWDTKLLRLSDYLNNPYLEKLKNLSLSKDDWSLSKKRITAYSLFPYEDEYHYGVNYNLKMSLAFFDRDYFYPSISLYKNEWMSLNPYEIRTMEIPIALAKGKVLTLGLGLGYFAYMAHLKDEVKEVHIVEMDKSLIEVFNEYFLPLFPHPEKIHIHKADAFCFIRDINDRDYDYIFSDLWHDVSDGLPMYLKLKEKFNEFKFTRCVYWIEGAIMTYLRTLVIGVMKDEFQQTSSDYNLLQLHIKESLKSVNINSSSDIDALLCLKGLNRLFFKE